MQEIEFKQPEIQVVNNVDVKAQTDANAIRDALVRQAFITQSAGLKRLNLLLCARGITQLLEIGPGKVLTGLTKRISKRDERCGS